MVEHLPLQYETHIEFVHRGMLSSATSIAIVVDRRSLERRRSCAKVFIDSGRKSRSREVGNSLRSEL